MKITPIDIQKHRFRNTFRGFDRDEVTAFMQAVSEQVEKSVLEINSLKEEVAGLRESVTGHEAKEKILRETLMTAQRLAEELKDAARKDGDLIVREAEHKADQLMSLPNNMKQCRTS